MGTLGDLGGYVGPSLILGTPPSTTGGSGNQEIGTPKRPAVLSALGTHLRIMV